MLYAFRTSLTLRCNASTSSLTSSFTSFVCVVVVGGGGGGAAAARNLDAPPLRLVTSSGDGRRDGVGRAGKSVLRVSPR